MKETLNIALIQSNLIWEHPEANRALFSEKINSITANVDIVFLPEMFTSGFTMNPESVAETMDGKTVTWMQQLAKEKQIAIAGSLIIKEQANYYNRLVFVKPNRSLEYYNKRHTFTLAGEHKVYKSGTKKVIVKYLGWNICLQICYDLRFPVWARNVEDYHVLCYVANWPKPRISAWDSLLKARAIENMSYCIGVNRVGLDANNHEYVGHSAVYNSLGKMLTNNLEAKEYIEAVSLSKTHLETTRNKFKFLEDRDSFTLLK